MEYLEIRTSRNGKGIFCTKDFKSEEALFQVTGMLIPCNKEFDLDEKTKANTYRYDKNSFISPKGTIGDFLNHSCVPNSKVMKNKQKLFIVTIRKILKDEEILIDYSSILARDDNWEMNCNCGSERCRKLIRKFDSLPNYIKGSYIQLQIVPHYILKI